MKREFYAPEEELRVGVLGTMGVAGQCSLTTLEQHPWFEATALVASPRSVGKTYEEVVSDHWKLDTPMPEHYKKMVIHNVNEVEQAVRKMGFVFSAVGMTKEEACAIKGAYAKCETPVVSNNSAHRWIPDVPMVISEVNPGHFEAAATQRKRLGTERDFVTVKPNCLTQSYAPAFVVWKESEPYEAIVTTYQAISGTDKNSKNWPEMAGNITPYIGGEEEKSEKEPLRIYGHIEDGHIESAAEPRISSQYIRMPVLSGHTAAVFVKFRKKLTKEQLLERLTVLSGLPQEMKLPSTLQQFIRYMEEKNRSQVTLDVNYEGGMDISIGRPRKNMIYDQKFVDFSHNTLHGTASGAVKRAEALTMLGHITAK